MRRLLIRFSCDLEYAVGKNNLIRNLECITGQLLYSGKSPYEFGITTFVENPAMGTFLTAWQS